MGIKKSEILQSSRLQSKILWSFEFVGWTFGAKSNVQVSALSLMELSIKKKKLTDEGRDWRMSEWTAGHWRIHFVRPSRGDDLKARFGRERILATERNKATWPPRRLPKKMVVRLSAKDELTGCMWSFVEHVEQNSGADLRTHTNVGGSLSCWKGHLERPFTD